MTNKYKYFVANWKMFGDLKTVNSINKVIKFSKSRKFNKAKIIYCPPFTLLNSFVQKLKNTKIEVGGQNCHQIDSNGPFTGSINSKMIKNLGCKYVIIGHSENRAEGETNLILNQKIKTALNNSLKILFCIGENLKEKRTKKTKRILNNQITRGLKSIRNINNIIFAYEPIWSIGTGLVPDYEDIYEVQNYVKSFLKNKKFIKKTSVLYGGSVSSNNITYIIKESKVDGALIGGSSIDDKEILKIISIL